MKSKYLLICGILLLTLPVSKLLAQVKKETTREMTFPVYDQVPVFPGGLEKFQEFIASNLKHIDDAAGKRALVYFVVEKDGSLTGIKVVRGINPEADKEAIRVISLSPKWKVI